MNWNCALVLITKRCNIIINLRSDDSYNIFINIMSYVYIIETTMIGNVIEKTEIVNVKIEKGKLKNVTINCSWRWEANFQKSMNVKCFSNNFWANYKLNISKNYEFFPNVFCVHVYVKKVVHSKLWVNRNHWTQILSKLAKPHTKNCPVKM